MRKKIKRWKYSRKLQNTKKWLSWNLFFYMIYFIVALSMRVLADISKEAWRWPKRRIWVNIKSLLFVKERSISFINCIQEGASLIRKQGTERKKCVFVSTSRPHEQNGLKVSWKLCLSDLDQGSSLVRYLIPL